MSAFLSTLHLERVEQTVTTIGTGQPARHLPIGLARRIARSAHESVARVIPSNVQWTLVLEWDGGSVRFEPDVDTSDRILTTEFERSISIHRGREGGRIVIQDAEGVFLNGWPLESNVPHLLGHGDVLNVSGRCVAVRYDPALRPFIEAGEVATGLPPGDVACEFSFAIEPSGEPLAVRCDPTIARALAELVLRHDPDRPFDPTALTEVERATLDWLIHRIADRAAGDVFGIRTAIRPAPLRSTPDLWSSVVVRVGSARGSVWFGTTGDGLRALVNALEPIARRQILVNPAVRGIYVTMAARVDLGRVSAVRLASLDDGDLLTSVELSSLGEPRWSAPGRVAIVGAGELTAHAQFELDSRTGSLAAYLVNTLDGGGHSMSTTFTDDVDAAVDHPFGDALDAIGVVVAIEIGRRRIRLSEALALTTGDVIELDGPVASKVSLLVDGAHFAAGELVDVDGMLGVRVISTRGRR